MWSIFIIIFHFYCIMTVDPYEKIKQITWNKIQTLCQGHKQHEFAKFLVLFFAYFMLRIFSNLSHLNSWRKLISSWRYGRKFTFTSHQHKHNLHKHEAKTADLGKTPPQNWGLIINLFFNKFKWRSCFPSRRAAFAPTQHFKDDMLIKTASLSTTVCVMIMAKRRVHITKSSNFISTNYRVNIEWMSWILWAWMFNEAWKFCLECFDCRLYIN